MDIWRGARELAGAIARGELSSTAVVTAHLERIEAVNAHVNAFVTVLADDALREARDPRPGPLSGVPVTVKDAFDTAGVRTTRGSALFADRVPDRDATAVARLRAAGAIVLGKTNLPELSWWTETDNPLVGRALNPYDGGRTPGGSSGGESAAIAAGMSPLGLGSDVAISVRGPAHDTGIAAIKPTHGRVPVTGHYSPRLRRWWHAGPMARTVADLRLALGIMEGPDGADPYATGPANARVPLAASADRPLRVGWSTDAFGPIDPEVAGVVRAAADAVADLGGTAVRRAELPWLAGTDHAVTSGVLFAAEMTPYLRGLVGDRESEVHPVVRAALATQAGDLDTYRDAEHAVERLRSGFAGWFGDPGGFDVLLAPVVVAPAPPHARRTLAVAGRELPGRAVVRATVPFNLTGLPAVSLPFGATAAGLPVGVQLVGRWGADHDLLAFAERLESRSPVRGRHPAL